MEARVLRNRLEKPKADVIYYLEHFPKRSISQFPNDLPYFLWVHVPVYVFILLLLLIGPQLEYLPKIEERHLFGRELTVLMDAVSSVISAKKIQRFLPTRSSNSYRNNSMQALNECRQAAIVAIQLW